MTQKKIINWFKLLAGLTLLSLLAFVILPWLADVPLAEEITKSNHGYDIDAGTLFYTETDQFNEVNNYMMNAADFPPKSYSSTEIMNPDK